MAPVVNGLVPEYESTVAIRMYDVGGDSSDALTLSNQYNVEYVPTFVFVNAQGELVDTIIGEVSEGALRDALDRLE
jgi:thiol:disulfide interchange protein